MKYIHRLLTYFFSPKQNSFIESAAVMKSFECFRSKNLLALHEEQQT